MIGLLGNMKFLRAALVFALFAASSQSADAEILEAWKRDSDSATPPAAPQQLQIDQKVIAAGFQDSPSAEADSPVVARLPVENHRLLAPPTRAQTAAPAEGRPVASAQASDFGLPKMESFATAAAGLAIVVGLFLVCMWMLRRGGLKPTTPLPSEAIAVLGRVPLAAQNFAHLLQVGNKLVLVAITPEGVSPITEVTDPAEVQRLIGLCLRNHKQSTTAEFHNVLDQLSKEPATGFLGNEVAGSEVAGNEVAGNKVATSYASQGRS